MEHLLLRSKCSIFHNIFKKLTFQRHPKGIFKCTLDHFSHVSNHYEPRSDCSYGSLCTGFQRKVVENPFVEYDCTPNTTVRRIQYLVEKKKRQERHFVEFLLKEVRHLVEKNRPTVLLWCFETNIKIFVYVYRAFDQFLISIVLKMADSLQNRP